MTYIILLFIAYIILLFSTKDTCTFSAPRVFHLPICLGDLSTSICRDASISVFKLTLFMILFMQLISPILVLQFSVFHKCMQCYKTSMIMKQNIIIITKCPSFPFAGHHLTSTLASVTTDLLFVSVCWRLWNFIIIGSCSI